MTKALVFVRYTSVNHALLCLPSAARVRALEDRIPEVQRGLRRHLSQLDPLPSRMVGQGTLVGRVAALELAMDTLLAAQTEVMDSRGGLGESDRTSSCGCCSIM